MYSIGKKRGERVTLIGPSGSGKTTILRMVNRMVDPTAGTITIDGQDNRGLDADTLRRVLRVAEQDTAGAVVAGASAAALVIAAMWLQHCCRSPEDPPEDCDGLTE